MSHGRVFPTSSLSNGHPCPIGRGREQGKVRKETIGRKHCRTQGARGVMPFSSWMAEPTFDLGCRRQASRR